MATHKIPMRKTTRMLVNAVKVEFIANRNELAPRLDAAGAHDPEFRNLQYAQNTLRTCIEATLNQMMPYDQKGLVELAIRLASYAISAAPLEDQDFMVADFMSIFADAHMQRVAEGKTIKSRWIMQDGSEVPND